jgi:leucyl aminopeptidase
MPIDFELDRDPPAEASVVVWGVTADALDSLPGELEVSAAYLMARGFKGRVGQTFAVPGAGDGPASLVVGLGPSGDLGPTQVRRAGGAIARAARRDRVIAVRLLDAIAEPARRPAAAAALAEGITLGCYRFATYKSDPEADAPLLERVVVVGGGGQRLKDQLALGARIATGVALARDLVNTPGGDLTPARLADAAVEIAEREGFHISVLDQEGIVEAGLGGLLGVNRGSTQPARFIEISYKPAGARSALALVGKGITFDSGGLSIKTAAGMTTMKDDMGGAAAILGALSVVKAVSPKVEIRAYIPATDNMTGGDATRVGDVLKIRNGKTVEVLNTDAEGRLVLADGLSVASEAKPDAIVDLATLTGAIEVALGKSVAGLFGNRDGWSEQVAEAGQRVGERTWTLPLIDDYRSHLDSEVADLRNIGRPMQAGSIIAGLFLREFVGEGIPWVHLDIAATAWSDSDDLEITKGGTGWGVRLLVELARTFRRPSRR